MNRQAPSRIAGDHARAAHADWQQIRALGQVARAWPSDPDGSQAAIADLVMLAQAGNEGAEGELLLVHTPHIRGLCWRLHVRASDVEDIVQDGQIAMRCPIRRFEQARGVPFWGYARHAVKGEIVFQLGHRAGLSRHQAGHYRAIRRAHDALVAEGAEPTPAAVHDRLHQTGRRGASVLTVAAVLDAVRARPRCLDERPWRR